MERRGTYWRGSQSTDVSLPTHYDGDKGRKQRSAWPITVKNTVIAIVAATALFLAFQFLSFGDLNRADVTVSESQPSTAPPVIAATRRFQTRPPVQTITTYRSTTRRATTRGRADERAQQARERQQQKQREQEALAQQQEKARVEQERLAQQQQEEARLKAMEVEQERLKALEASRLEQERLAKEESEQQAEERADLQQQEHQQQPEHQQEQQPEQQQEEEKEELQEQANPVNQQLSVEVPTQVADQAETQPPTTSNGDPGSIPRGMHPDKASTFSQGFTCLKDGQQQPLALHSINDNYCDCHDGADEPGTSACAGQAISSGFWCSVEQVSILSSRVNDGIADCCDCSDEWSSGMECDTSACKQYEEAKAAHAAMVQQGLVLQASQRQAGEAARALLDNGVASPWGDNDAYYPLYEECLSLAASGYEYTLCLFKDLVQKGSDGRTITIGRHYEWTSPHRGLVSKGDACPEVGARSAVVRFECGLEPRLVRISEPGRCAYEAVVTAPAAC
eukprot:m.39586 g.39586  ORF g.39586 m.39586 type:complete len:509 (-) comp12683_c0_seq1:349-1875(-)